MSIFSSHKCYYYNGIREIYSTIRLELGESKTYTLHSENLKRRHIYGRVALKGYQRNSVWV
jgi:hypothetical protein